MSWSVPAFRAMLPVNVPCATFIFKMPAPPLAMLSAVMVPPKVSVPDAGRMIASLSPTPAEGLKEMAEVIVVVPVLIRAPLSSWRVPAVIPMSARSAYTSNVPVRVVAVVTTWRRSVATPLALVMAALLITLLKPALVKPNSP